MTCKKDQTEKKKGQIVNGFLLSNIATLLEKKDSLTSSGRNFSLVDPIPTLGSFLQQSVIAYRSVRRGYSLQKGAIFDIEWGVER